MRFPNSELKNILKKHHIWILDESRGARANLCDADLSNVRLYDAYLHRADLYRANLCGANLIDADLSEANLREAILCKADLDCTDLSGANLRSAILSGANLNGVNFQKADLVNVDFHSTNLVFAQFNEADLRGADLRGLDLSCADLRGANLYGADLRGAKNVPFLPQTIVCPEEGSFIGFKKVNGCLVKLEIPEDAKRSSATTRKCRCEFAKVLSITDISRPSRKLTEISNYAYYPTTYRVGEIVYPDSFDEDRWNECSHGIHFFVTRQEAVEY